MEGVRRNPGSSQQGHKPEQRLPWGLAAAAEVSEREDVHVKGGQEVAFILLTWR